MLLLPFLMVLLSKCDFEFGWNVEFGGWVRIVDPNGFDVKVVSVGRFESCLGILTILVSSTGSAGFTTNPSGLFSDAIFIKSLNETFELGFGRTASASLA